MIPFHYEQVRKIVEQVIHGDSKIQRQRGQELIITSQMPENDERGKERLMRDYNVIRAFTPSNS
ncbi:hypothetical protein ccbrp13_02960 [Ktedonobacteria bacterium brp13]|nr:hypothetical protein ccbrp13_02960 [Ktedonobacteria bacterium brp13]